MYIIHIYIHVYYLSIYLSIYLYEVYALYATVGYTIEGRKRAADPDGQGDGFIPDMQYCISKYRIGIYTAIIYNNNIYILV